MEVKTLFHGYAKPPRSSLCLVLPSQCDPSPSGIRCLLSCKNKEIGYRSYIIVANRVSVCMHRIQTYALITSQFFRELKPVSGFICSMKGW
jgi:hypothetical protein